MNPIEGLEIQLMLSTIIKLPLSLSKKFILDNDGIWTTSTLLRQDIVNIRKRWKNDMITNIKRSVRVQY